MEMKRIMLKKSEKVGKTNIVAKMEPTYRLDDPSKRFQSLLKRGYSMQNIADPDVLPLVSKIKCAKRNYVDNLLKQRFGDNWRSLDSLKFYPGVIDQTVEENDEDNAHDVQDVICHCLEEEEGLEML